MAAEIFSDFSRQGVFPGDRPLHRIISIAPGGAITEHWKLADGAMAARMAARLARQLGPTGERVQLRRVIDVRYHVVCDVDVSSGLRTED